MFGYGSLVFVIPKLMELRELTECCVAVVRDEELVTAVQIGVQFTVLP